jgi:hypothetical protein
VNPHPTPEQLEARLRFDIDEAIAALPEEPKAVPTKVGAAGYRLSGDISARIPDDLLREFAADTLGAKRMSADYLDALRVVLGNQSDAERKRYRLEMNIRTDFSTERIMRNIINQMKSAGITSSVEVQLGLGRKQVVQVYNDDPEIWKGGPADTLEALDRADEWEADWCMRGKVWTPSVHDAPLGGVPY